MGLVFVAEIAMTFRQKRDDGITLSLLPCYPSGLYVQSLFSFTLGVGCLEGGGGVKGW